MSKQKVTIAGKEYLLDIEKAKKDGYLSEPSLLEDHKFSAGDVFRHPSGKTIPFMLVKVTNNKDAYQLFGWGYSPISGDFFEYCHNIKEIKAYLISQGMIFYRNIRSEISDLVCGY